MSVCFEDSCDDIVEICCCGSVCRWQKIIVMYMLHVACIIICVCEADVGVMCRGQLISALLYAADAVIFAEDEELMRRGLDILDE